MNIYRIHKSFPDNYKNHQALKELFPGEAKVLYQNNGSSLLVLTDATLDKKHESDMIEHLGDSNDAINKVINSENVFFSVRLNGVKANGRKKFTLYKDKIDEWVDWKLGKAGVKLVGRVIKDEGVLVSERKGSHCWHASLLVMGVLKVEDKDKFVEAVTKGVGHGKAFGFGLLNVFGN